MSAETAEGKLRKIKTLIDTLEGDLKQVREILRGDKKNV